MDERRFIEIEVACAWPKRQVTRILQVRSGTTARQALRLSGLADDYTDIDCDTATLGVFGRVVPDTYVTCPGDRIEVYRPLCRDPREARRARVALSTGRDRPTGFRSV